MLSPTSLAAFSSGVSQAGFVQSDAMQRIRSTVEQPQALPAPRPAPPTAPAPNQKLPRGSLLDLSV